MIINASLAWIDISNKNCLVTYDDENSLGKDPRKPNNWLGKLALNVEITTGDNMIIKGSIPKSVDLFDYVTSIGGSINAGGGNEYYGYGVRYLKFYDESDQKGFLDKLYVCDDNFGYKKSKKRFLRKDEPEFWWIDLNRYLLKDQTGLREEELVITDRYLIRSLSVAES